MDGVPIRENNNRNAEYMSLIVPTVDLAFPPRRLWSMTTEGFKLSIYSTWGRSYFGRRPRIHAVYVSFICLWLSAAIVSKTMLDFPDPDTPVNTTILCFGISREMFFRLFCFNPLITIFLCSTIYSPLSDVHQFSLPVYHTPFPQGESQEKRSSGLKPLDLQSASSVIL